MASPEMVHQLAVLLRETTAADATRIAAAEAQLAVAADAPGFGAALLTCISHASDPDPSVAAVAVPAATSLHNYARRRWPARLIPGERETLRAAVLQTLLVAPAGPIVKLLAETFRIIVTEDVSRAKCWPDLLPALCGAMQESNLMVGKEASAVKTANALVAVHTLLKPYKYFQNPGMDKEAAPPELEAIVKALLEPLLGMLNILATGTLAAAAAENGDPGAVSSLAANPVADQPGNDALLHTLLKCFHHTVAAYMPNALVPSLPRWLEVLVKLLEHAPSWRMTERRSAEPRARAAKRAVQTLISLVTRHRRHVDRALPQVCAHAAAFAGAIATRRLESTESLPSTASRLCALCFDLLARVSETAAGFRLLAPDFGRLLETAVFPALCASPEDETDWDEDEEEYLQKNLPTDADDPTGFNEELYAPRQSAANLLGLLAERGSSGGAPGDDKSDKNDKGKRKKGGAKSKSGARRPSSSPGDVTLRFLERFAVPTPSADIRASSSYYGALVAYGALAGWLGGNAPSGTVNTLARQRVLPALEPGAIGESTLAVMIRANAC